MADAATMPKPATAEAQQELTDGFNLIITVEVALSGGLVLDCHDGTVRDLAGLRGSYHPVDETDGALDLIGRELGALAPAHVNDPRMDHEKFRAVDNRAVRGEHYAAAREYTSKHACRRQAPHARIPLKRGRRANGQR